ncbi:MAG TPA: DUF2267 domain-containing protein [Chitinispirillaceae bacterium]|nr:DUF2267 domain-containing protein [Chitinispirillaceae bacterium]
MHYDEFLQEVKKRAELADESAAAAIVDASLSTLGERLESADRESLGAQLPKELKAVLYERQSGDLFNLEEYYNRVGARAGTGYRDAVRYSRVVMSVLSIAVTSGLLSQILSSLPGEFAELFGQKPLTPLSPSSLPE